MRDNYTKLFGVLQLRRVQQNKLSIPKQQIKIDSPHKEEVRFKIPPPHTTQR